MSDPAVVTLPDGRTLAYDVCGDPGGRPVLYFHGFPGSRLEGRLGHDGAAKAGARLIVVERPGFGHSSFQPGRRILDWPDDVAALANALGLKRFGVVGVSGGGPYAAACAYRIPQRLTGVAMVCGVGPFDAPEATRGMMRLNRILFRLSRYSKTAPRLILASMARQIRRDPARALAQMRAIMPEPDRRSLDGPGVAEHFMASALEALRQGSRPAGLESQLYARPWGFRLEDVTREVHLYQGELDVNVPPSMGRYQASALPNCRAHFYADEGHLSLVLNHLEEILSAVLG